MTDIPIIMLVFVLGFITIILTMGYIFRTKFPISMLLFFSGAIFLFLFVTTDNIQALGLDTTESFDYTLSYPMNVTTTNANSGFSATRTSITEKPNTSNSLLLNKPISCIEISMRKANSPVGNGTIGIFDNDNMVIKEFGIIDVSTINTSTRGYRFCLDNHDYWIISASDRIGMKYIGADATNRIDIAVDTTNPFDSTNSVKSDYISGTWSDVLGEDLRMILTNEELTISNQEETYPIRNPITFEPTFIGISLILLSLCLIVLGGLVETGKFN